MNAPRVSIAMTTYNGAAYLQEQLDSLAAQSRPPAELVVGDDGSADTTIDILQRFAATAPFVVRVLRNPQRLGYRANFMNVARQCTGDLISFCDQDDVWRPDKLSKVVAAFEQTDVLMAFHNSLIVDAARHPVSPFYGVPPMPAVAARLTLSPWMFSYGFTQTFRAELLPAASLSGMMMDPLHPSELIGHDVFFFILAAGLGCIAYLDEPLVEYRQHGKNVFGSGKRTKPGFVDRWRYRLEDRSATYAYLARVAAVNAQMFNRLSGLKDLAPVLRARAPAAAAAWAALPAFYEDRAALCAAGPAARVAAFARLLRRGAYGEAGFWTFGAKAMVKDLVLGMALAPLVQKYGRASSKSDRALRRGRNRLAV
jgi:glycosyltransferase involved in cell wall biosynthesis